MQKLTAGNIVAFIKQLNKNNYYNYIHKSTKGVIKIVSVDGSEGPIKIKRWVPSAEKNEANTKVESISSEMIWRIANAFLPNYPINFDRVLGASYNTRSVLEALIAHTSQFYFCYPGRVANFGDATSVEHGHKHVMWCPDKPHKNGRLEEIKTDLVISEIPQLEATYDSLFIPPSIDDQFLDISIDIKRRHAQIQVALYFIGKHLQFRTWIAQNDKGILYQNKRLAEYDGIIDSLREERLMSAHEEAIKAALLIDCIWFKNGRLMPAVMEIEHSTGVTSGLTRMKNFQDKFPPFPTRYVIVAADEEREHVIREAQKPQFSSLETRFFPYSAVEELFALCQRRKLRGITEDFLDCYMEPVFAA